MGFGAALVLVSTLAMITDLTERGGHRGGLGMGVFDFTNIFGYALGYLIGSILYQLMRGAGGIHGITDVARHILRHHPQIYD